MQRHAARFRASKAGQSRRVESKRWGFPPDPLVLLSGRMSGCYGLAALDAEAGLNEISAVASLCIVAARAFVQAGLAAVGVRPPGGQTQYTRVRTMQRQVSSPRAMGAASRCPHSPRDERAESQPHQSPDRPALVP